MNIKEIDPTGLYEMALCDSFRITEIESFQALLDAYKEYQDKYKDCAILLTLDDLGQAGYTSMHATTSQDLDNTEGYDLTKLDPRAFDEGEHVGCLTTRSEFYIRKENFERKVVQVNFTSARDRGLGLDDAEVELLEAIHASPIEYIDKQVILYVVPVETAAMTMSVFPNGYFSSDLNPFENYAVAKYLSDKFGYKLMGVGASLLGFIRDKPLTEAESDLLATELAYLYNQDSPQAPVQRLAALTRSNNFLFLKYIEYLEM